MPNTAIQTTRLMKPDNVPGMAVGDGRSTFSRRCWGYEELAEEIILAGVSLSGCSRGCVLQNLESGSQVYRCGPGVCGCVSMYRCILWTAPMQIVPPRIAASGTLIDVTHSSGSMPSSPPGIPLHWRTDWYACTRACINALQQGTVLNLIPHGCIHLGAYLQIQIVTIDEWQCLTSQNS
jgi:hypothetical protein